MISIIVCSRSLELFKKLQKNIAETIGITYEVIRIDNSKSNYSICAAYNLGASKSQYNILCFIHEDIIIKTKQWGELLLNHFSNDDSLGMVGLAGSKYKHSIACSWGAADYPNNCHNIYHFDNNVEKHDFCNPLNEPVSNVVVLDGVWLTVKKEIYDQIKFDEDFLKGFHCYDIDFSLRASLITKLIVVYNIDVTHLSKGNFDNNWMIEQLKLEHHLKKISRKKYYTSQSNTVLNKLQNKFINITYRSTFKYMCYNNSFKLDTIKLWLTSNKEYVFKHIFFTIKNYLRAIYFRRKTK